MKNRMKALLLAAVLGTSAMLMCWAGEAGAQAAASEAAAEADPEGAGRVEALTESQEAGEAAGVADEASGEESTLSDYYDDIKQSVAVTIENLTMMTDTELQGYIDSDDPSNRLICAKWKNVKKELGSFVEVTSQTIEENEAENTIRITSDVVYDQVPEGTKVTVDYLYNYKNNTVDMDWNIDYPVSKLFAEAGLNTLMGLGIVFLVLVFLSFIISRFSLLSGLTGEGKKQETKAAAAPAAPAAPAPEAEAEEEELSDDGELAAVIAAAIAAYEETPADGFVVRSIRKANRNKWLNA